MIRTLVVDDDYRVADLHCAYLERVAGFEVAGRVHTGAAALTGVAQLRPDLVLLDIYLPDMTGLEVLQRLREDETAPVDVIAITAARERMARLGRADQGDVDRIFGALRTATAVTLPKGLSDATLELILQALGRSSSGLPAAAVADEAGVSRVTARRYLDHLCQLGRVELTMRYGGPGRPEHRYRLVAPLVGTNPARDAAGR